MTTSDPPPFSTGDPLPAPRPTLPDPPTATLEAAYDVLAGEVQQLKARVAVLEKKLEDLHEGLRDAAARVY